jgi:hypothetical protein
VLTFDDLAAWAGAEHVIRAVPAAVAGWQIPENQKLMLVNIGVPVVDHLIEYADFQTEPDPVLQTSSGVPLYRLTRNHHRGIRPGLQWTFGAEPHTGKVFYVLPGGEAWFANSTIGLWLRTLHHYGLRVSQSATLSNPDPNEDQALAELHGLAEELREIDPPAFAGDLGFIWPKFLERWLW